MLADPLLSHDVKEILKESFQEELPPDYDRWSVHQKIERQTQRVAQELPVYSFLEEEGVFSLLEDEKLLDEIHDTKDQLKEIQKVVELVKDEEFTEAYLSLKMIIFKLDQLRHEKMKLLAKILKKPHYAHVYDKLIKQVKANSQKYYEEGERQEGIIMDVCDQYKVCPLPFLLLDEG